MQIKKILYATDFSECSEHAGAYALDLARRYGARLYVLHVIYDLQKSAAWYVSQIDSVDIEALYAEMKESAEAELKRIGAELLEGYADMDPLLVRGEPREEILRCIEEQGMDLVVLGSHGRKGIDRVIFGSTASKIVRSAPCPVLTVRA